MDVEAAAAAARLANIMMADQASKRGNTTSTATAVTDTLRPTAFLDDWNDDADEDTTTETKEKDTRTAPKTHRPPPPQGPRPPGQSRRPPLPQGFRPMRSSERHRPHPLQQPASEEDDGMSSDDLHRGEVEAASESTPGATSGTPQSVARPTGIKKGRGLKKGGGQRTYSEHAAPQYPRGRRFSVDLLVDRAFAAVPAAGAGEETGGGDSKLKLTPTTAAGPATASRRSRT